jgi:hypothetical protein
MAGEGNGDAWLAVLGLLVGGSLAHNLGLVSSAQGSTEAGRVALGIGWAVAPIFAVWVVSSHRREAARAPDPVP